VEAALGSQERRVERADVAPVELGDAAVGQDEAAQRLVERPGLVELHGRDHDALLEAVLGVRGDAPGDDPADIGGVQEAPGEAHQFAPREDRAEHHVVGQVGGHAARVKRVVGQDHVARFERVEALDRRLHRHREHVGDADVARIGEDVALAGDEGAVEVPGLLDEGGERRAVDRVAHLLDDPGEAVREDLEQNLVKLHRRWPPQ
jgi:hypothetical protein